jgi:hypothetical protein
MGNEDKKSLIDHAKSGVNKVQTEASRAAVKGAKAIAAGAGSVKTGAGKAKDLAAAKAKLGLEKAYAKKKPLAVDNLKRLRKANPSASPTRILEILNEELHAVEQESSDSAVLIDAITLYVLSCIEVYGAKAKGKAATKKLTNATLVLSSQVAKLATKYGPVAIEIAIAVLRKKVPTKVVKTPGVKKASVLAPLVRLALAKLVGVENIGRKSATKIAETAVAKALGTPPAKWPAATKPRSTPLK